MVMIPTCKAKNQDTAVKLLGDAILLLAKIEETCKNRDHALIVKKFVFSNHVADALSILLDEGHFGKLEARLILTILHQHLSERIFAELDQDVLKIIERVLMQQLPSSQKLETNAA